MNTDYWFDKRLAKRLVDALLKIHHFALVRTYTVHEDGDKAMLELNFATSSSSGTQRLTTEAQKTAHREKIIYFILGFEAAHKSTAQGVLPNYVVGHEGRSGYRLDQTNRLTGALTEPRRFNSVVSLPSSAAKGDAEAALNAAYDGVYQFCRLNGLEYPQTAGGTE
jgi:hypothetical protein